MPPRDKNEDPYKDCKYLQDIFKVFEEIGILEPVRDLETELDIVDFLDTDLDLGGKELPNLRELLNPAPVAVKIPKFALVVNRAVTPAYE